MTAPRLARGSRSRFLLYVACLLGLLGLMAVYHNTLTQLDEVRKRFDTCQSQQGSLSAQLQVIFEYKTRLEKFLQSEKIGHKQTRMELQKRADSEKLKCDKNTMESNLRYSALQQQFKLLQSKNEDVKKEASKIQKQLNTEVNALQSQMKESIEEQKQINKEKDNTIESLKTQYAALLAEKSKIEYDAVGAQGGNDVKESEINRLKKLNIQLQREYDQLKVSCLIDNGNTQSAHEVSNTFVFDNEPVVDKNRNIAKMVEVVKGAYQLKDANNKSVSSIVVIPNNLVKVPPSENRPSNLVASKDDTQVIPQPNMGDMAPKGSSSTSTTRSGNQAGGPIGVKPLASPTPTLSRSTKETNVVLNAANVLVAPNLSDASAKKVRKVPPGVVPIPENIGEEPGHEMPHAALPDNGRELNENLPEPNRYHNSILDNKEDEPNKRPLKKPKTLSNEAGGGEVAPDPVMILENGAVEVIDAPNAKNVQDDPLSVLNARHDAFGEVENGNQEIQAVEKKHIDTMNMNRGRQLPGGNRMAGGFNYEGDAGDYEKDPEKGGDLQIEENEAEGEEDDDGDDYNAHIEARQKDPIVRN